MKNKLKIILWLTVVVMLLMTYVVFSGTLALFETDSTGVVNSDIGKWVIKINNETITNGENETIDINNFVYASNPKVQTGKIAPGGSAYFDLTIDASECDVAVLYNVNLNLDQTNYGSNIVFGIQSLNGTTVVYSGIITLAQINSNTNATFRVTITWQDIAANDATDTELGLTEGSTLSIPITFSATQYLGETLTPYSG